MTHDQGKLPFIFYNISQENIIQRINQYITSQCLPYKFDIEGMCNGLANVYGKYVLENRENKFIELLNTISKLDSASLSKFTADQHDDINNFIINVIASMNPKSYDSQLNQQNAMETLAIHKDKEYKRLDKPIFQIAIMSRPEKGAQIIEKLNLKSGEILRFNTSTHALCISKNGDGSYNLYDPSYPQLMEKKSLAEILNHISENYCRNQPFAMHLMLYENPFTKNRNSDELPNFKECYELCRPNKSHTDNNLNPLNFAMNADDLNAVLYLLKECEFTKQQIFHAIGKAVFLEQTNSVQALLEHMENKDSQTYKNELISHIHYAAKIGSRDCFNVLLKKYEEKYKEKFLEVCSEENLVALINSVASNHRYLKSNEKGQQGQLFLDELLDKIKTDKLQFNPSWLLDLSDGENALTKSIEIGSFDNLRALLNKIEKVYTLKEKELLFLIEKAVKSNQPFIITEIIEYARSHNINLSLNSIKFGLHVLEPATINTLLLLEKYGYQFQGMEKQTYEFKQKGLQEPSNQFNKAQFYTEKFTTWLKLQLSKEHGLIASKNELFQYPPTQLTKKNRSVEEIKREMEELCSSYNQRDKNGKGDDYLRLFSGSFGGFTAKQKKTVVEKLLNKKSLSADDEKIANQGRLKKLVCELREAEKRQTQEPNEKKPGNPVTKP